MIDHMGFSVSDYERAKAFYLKALAPLGYSLVMEVPGETNPSGYPAAGFGEGGKPDFWIGAEGGLNHPLHVAIVAKTRAAVDAFYKAAMEAGARDNGPPIARRNGDTDSVKSSNALSGSRSGHASATTSGAICR